MARLRYLGSTWRLSARSGTTVMRLAVAAVALFGTVVVAQTAEAPAPNPAPAAPSNPHSLSIDEALQLALPRSEQVQIARAAVDRADAGKLNAFSEWLPQLNATASYTRTLKSQFDALRTAPDSGAAGGGTSGGAGGNATSSGGAQTPSNIAQFFASPNSWRAGLSFSENLFAGGRTIARNQLASANYQNAELGLSSTRASAVLDVAQAYYDAVLQDRLVFIAEETLRQTEDTLSQIRVAREVGNRPEFDLLRAEVAVENQRPVVVRQRIQRDLAYLRLKQLLQLPLDEPLQLTSGLEADALAHVIPSAQQAARVNATAEDLPRVVVQQARLQVDAQHAAVRIAQSERFPQLSITSTYGLVNFSDNPLNRIGESWFQNWDVGVALSVPLFTGFRITSDVRAAEADLAQTRSQAKLTEELAALDTRSNQDALRAAEAQWEATRAAVDLAKRAYDIAKLRFEEGISTQLELTDARIAFEQAGANRAQAARDLQIARIRVALLRYLPLSQVTAPGSAANVAAGSTVNAATGFMGGPATSSQVTPNAIAPASSVGTSTSPSFQQSQTGAAAGAAGTTSGF